MRIPALYNTEVWSKMYAEAEHQMNLRFEKINFRSIAEDHVFYDDGGRAEAVINTISYVREDAEERPVMFLWNGGPGSATSCLHLECFGPYQMAFDKAGRQQYGLEEDEDCLLDICDLVFVDPVGVGYSRLLNPDAEEKYYSLMGDARSNAFAVLDWIRSRRRWNSPIYLMGESYGTIRVSRILEELARDPLEGNKMMLGLDIAGVILVGAALSLDEKGNIIDPKLDKLTATLPSMAAVNWYHNSSNTASGSAQISEKDFVEDAWRFAAKELRPAQFLGDECPKEEIVRIAGKLQEFTGMDADYFIKRRLCLNDIEDFMIQVTSQKGTRVDIYDARNTISLSEKYNLVGDGNVPLRIMNGILAEKLNIETDRQYYTGNINVNERWSMAGVEHPTNMDCLRNAMNRMPDMKVLVASGRYDLCTLLGNTRYIFSHAGLPKEPLTIAEYSGGHGVYSSEEGKREFLADIRTMITK